MILTILTIILDHLPEIGATVTPLLIWLYHRRTKRDRRVENAEQTAELAQPIEHVRELVNDRMDVALAKIEALEEETRHLKRQLAAQDAPSGH